MFRKLWFEIFFKVIVVEKYNEIDLVMYMYGKKKINER